MIGRAVCIFLLASALGCGDAALVARDGGATDAPIAAIADAAAAGPDACPLASPEWGRGGDLMLAGSDCLSCHRSGGFAASTVFSVAGTVFSGTTCPVAVEGAVVHVVGRDGTRLDLTTNLAGNFFSAASLTPPLEVSVERGGAVLRMASPASSGSCNLCHEPRSVGYLFAAP